MNLELFAGKTKGRLPKLDSLEDKIAAYELDLLADLSPRDMEIRERWLKLWSKLINFHSPTQAVNAHVKQCKQEGASISTRTAWDDYRKCTLLWGNLMEAPKKAKRIIVEEYAMKTFQMATQKKDIDGMNRAVANLIKISSLDRPDSEIAAGAAGNNFYFMAVYTKGAEKPKIVNLDELNNIPESEYETLMSAVEDQEVTDVEIQMLMEEEGLDGSKSA